MRTRIATTTATTRIRDDDDDPSLHFLPLPAATVMTKAVEAARTTA
jgi:hypothetical protein